MFGEHSGLNWGTLAAIYMALLLFGIVYNLITAWLERQGYAKGYVSLLVVGGVVVTVGLTAFISLPFALVTAGAFIASGTPMIIGSIWRHVREREQYLEDLRREARSVNTTQEMAP